jgi:hypothetical protein
MELTTFLNAIKDDNTKLAFENEILIDPIVFCLRYKMTIKSELLRRLNAKRRRNITKRDIRLASIEPCPVTSKN